MDGCCGEKKFGCCERYLINGMGEFLAQSGRKNIRWGGSEGHNPPQHTRIPQHANFNG